MSTNDTYKKLRKMSKDDLAMTVLGTQGELQRAQREIDGLRKEQKQLIAEATVSLPDEPFGAVEYIQTIENRTPQAVPVLQADEPEEKLEPLTQLYTYNFQLLVGNDMRQMSAVGVYLLLRPDFGVYEVQGSDDGETVLTVAWGAVLWVEAIKVTNADDAPADMPEVTPFDPSVRDDRF